MARIIISHAGGQGSIPGRNFFWLDTETKRSSLKATVKFKLNATVWVVQHYVFFHATWSLSYVARNSNELYFRHTAEDMQKQMYLDKTKQKPITFIHWNKIPEDFFPMLVLHYTIDVILTWSLCNFEIGLSFCLGMKV